MINIEIQTQRFAAQLFTYPLPQQTELLERRTQFEGSVNGDLCSFRAILHLTTTLEPVIVTQYYKQLVITPLSLETYTGMRDGSNNVYVKSELAPSHDHYFVQVQISDTFAGQDLDLRCQPPEMIPADVP